MRTINLLVHAAGSLLGAGWIFFGAVIGAGAPAPLAAIAAVVYMTASIPDLRSTTI